MEKVKTKSDEGVPLEVHITEDSIEAFRVEKPELEVIGKEKGKPEEELEAKLAERPVMEIWKTDEDEFSVDWEAGFQRGRVSGETKKDLIEGVDIDMYGGPDIHSDKGWLEWIGLDPESDYLDDFLGRDERMEEKLEEEVI